MHVCEGPQDPEFGTLRVERAPLSRQLHATTASTDGGRISAPIHGGRHSASIHGGRHSASTSRLAATAATWREVVRDASVSLPL